jgi:hypothetical protein
MNRQSSPKAAGRGRDGPSEVQKEIRNDAAVVGSSGGRRDAGTVCEAGIEASPIGR